jgi:TonB family protein
VPAASTPPPPSSRVPTHSSPTPYVLGAIVLAGLAFGLYYVKSRSSEKPTTPQVVTVSATAARNDPPPLNAPPPPPKIEDLPDAGEDAEAPKAQAKSPSGPAPVPCSNCQGSATPALQSALTSTAQSARGCYTRALRTSEVSGNMTVSVQVGSSGSVCGASVTNDSVRSQEVSSCVLTRFRGRTFPPPSGGCVTVNIPLSFTIKQ